MHIRLFELGNFEIVSMSLQFRGTATRKAIFEI